MSLQWPETWRTWLPALEQHPAGQKLSSFLAEAESSGAVYPPAPLRFAALAYTPPEAVKVVILGQDPYHGPGQAHGLSFSVPDGVAIPPSLANIYKELSRDFDLPAPQSGNLAGWAQQGVLLLNAVLSVNAGAAGSHRKKGWETLTDLLIAELSRRQQGLVFLLWGKYAEDKAPLIDTSRHCVLTSPHPSPLSAYRGFIGNGHFSRANAYLQQQGKSPIRWLPDMK